MQVYKRTLSCFAAVKPSPYPNPYRQTTWNNITDGINTLGQDSQQKQTTLRKLHNQRTRNRLRNISEANRAKLKAKHQAWLNSQ